MSWRCTCYTTCSFRRKSIDHGWRGSPTCIILKDANEKLNMDDVPLKLSTNDKNNDYYLRMKRIAGFLRYFVPCSFHTGTQNCCYCWSHTVFSCYVYLTSSSFEVFFSLLCCESIVKMRNPRIWWNFLNQLYFERTQFSILFSTCF